jgi:hypothetical protein
MITHCHFLELLIISICPFICHTDHSDKIISWQAPVEINSSAYYKLQANGRDIFVYDSPIAAYAMFDFEGTVNVTIKAGRDVKWVDIRPKSTGIKPEFRDSTIHFTLTNPSLLSIELNGEFSNQPLFLFTGKPEIQVPDKSDKNVIWFEGGKIHKPGIIEVRTGQTVYIEGGAVVEGIIHAENAAWDGVLSVTPENKAYHSQYRGYIRDITFKDIYITDGLFPFSIFCGFDEEHQVENVTIENLVVHGRKISNPEEAKIYQEFTKNIRLR